MKNWVVKNAVNGAHKCECLDEAEDTRAHWSDVRDEGLHGSPKQFVSTNS